MTEQAEDGTHARTSYGAAGPGADGVARLPSPDTLPPSAGATLLARYLDGLAALDHARLSPRQLALACDAARALHAAALIPAAALAPSPGTGLGSRRRATLLERLIAHVDANLRAPLSTEALCAALGCSRSALYRATAEVGGVTELVVNRRLIAVRARLADARDRRPIAAIAGEHGFPDPAQFSRRFKSLFGLPPGTVRRTTPAAGKA